jgi:hypothetical protein
VVVGVVVGTTAVLEVVLVLVEVVLGLVDVEEVVELVLVVRLRSL